jgi:hypothetical protein
MIINREDWFQYIGSRQWVEDIDNGKVLPSDSEQVRLYGECKFAEGKLAMTLERIWEGGFWLTEEYLQEHHIDGKTPARMAIPVPEKSAMAWLADVAPALAFRLPDLIANWLVEIDPNKPDVLNFNATSKIIAYVFKAFAGYSRWQEIALHVLSRGKEIKPETLKRNAPQVVLINKKYFYFQPTGRKASTWPLWKKILKIK